MKETSLTECKATERYVESPGVIASGVGARVRNENIGSRREISKNFEDKNQREGVPASLKGGKGGAGEELIMFQIPRLQNDSAGKSLHGLQPVGKGLVERMPGCAAILQNWTNQGNEQSATKVFRA